LFGCLYGTAEAVPFLKSRGRREVKKQKHVLTKATPSVAVDYSTAEAVPFLKIRGRRGI
jgi:hypothetical protein